MTGMLLPPSRPRLRRAIWAGFAAWMQAQRKGSEHRSRMFGARIPNFAGILDVLPAPIA